MARFDVKFVSTYALLLGILAIPNANGKEPTVPVVSPTLEIEVLDPNADPLGNPAVNTRDVGGYEVVEIPPVVLVHRYYYTGNREFQGPLLPGGPTILVVNHPRTNERLYIPLQMLPGAPQVRYEKRSIEYDYGANGITLSFGLCGKPKVTYRTGTPISRKVKTKIEKVGNEAGEILVRTNIPIYADAAFSGAKNVTATAADRLGEGSRMALLPVVNLFQLIPFAKTLTSTPEQRAQSLRDKQIHRAELKTSRQPDFIPTNR